MYDETPLVRGWCALVADRETWRAHPIDGDLVLGSAAAVTVVGHGVAGRHCRLSVGARGVTVVEPPGCSATTIGGRPVGSRGTLAGAGAVVRLGRAPVIVAETRTGQLGTWIGIGGFGGWAAEVVPALADLALVADAAWPALVLGESGTGKELAAQAIHAASPRSGRPLVAVNCGALHGDLLLAELFGAERGAYTGCHERRRGAFERADGGTLFLDEVGELSAAAQAALLRVLEVGEIQVLGGPARQVDVRLVCATHRDLPAMVAAGAFRLDLWHRLAIVPVILPPLRKRRADLAPLAATFLAEVAPGASLSEAAVAALLHHAWPGNVRELKNLMLRLAHTARTGVPDAADVARALAPPGGRPAVDPGPDRLEAVRALVDAGASAQQAWRASGLPRATFYRYLKRARDVPESLAA